MDLQFTNTWWALALPLILIIMDILTGYYNAWKNNEVYIKLENI